MGLLENLEEEATQSAHRRPVGKAPVLPGLVLCEGFLYGMALVHRCKSHYCMGGSENRGP